jgi:uncharacterized membrane protein YhaH (DUF805 family)
MSLPMSAPPLNWPHYGIGFGGAIVRGFKKYATFVGRASRSEYWWWTLFTTIVLIGLTVPTLVIGIQTSPDGGDTPGLPAVPLLILIALFYLAVLVPSIAVAARRLHDAGYSGWLLLLALIPSLGGLVVLVFTLLPPSPAGAKYDPAGAYPPGPSSTSGYPAGLYPPSDPPVPYLPASHPPDPPRPQ